MKAAPSLVLLLLVFFSFCQYGRAQSNRASDDPKSIWYKQYQPVTEANAAVFLQQGLSYATELYGAPKIPVNRVFLRLSTPLDPSSKIKRGFLLTELADDEKGIFVIYLSSKPAEYAFYGQLAHEIAHLLNARLYDCYVEGLNTVFAEKLLRRRGLDWSGWQRYFEAGADPQAAFYGAVYAMMKEVSQKAGDKAMKNFLGHAETSPQNSQRMYLDVESWLKTLPVQTKSEVRKAILRHAPAVRQAMGGIGEQNACIVPQ